MRYTHMLELQIGLVSLLIIFSSFSKRGANLGNSEATEDSLEINGASTSLHNRLKC